MKFSPWQNRYQTCCSVISHLVITISHVDQKEFARYIPKTIYLGKRKLMSVNSDIFLLNKVKGG
jgi:hypothetical protein